MAKKKSEEPIGETKEPATETKLSQHGHYLVKKEVAKLIMTEKGCKFQEAFDSVPDEAIVSTNHKEIYDALKK